MRGYILNRQTQNFQNIKFSHQQIYLTLRVAGAFRRQKLLRLFIISSVMQCNFLLYVCVFGLNDLHVLLLGGY